MPGSASRDRWDRGGPAVTPNEWAKTGLLMSQDRRAQLDSQLDAALGQAETSASRMEVLCALAVAELSVNGAGATVLTTGWHGDGDGMGDGDGDGRNYRRGLVHATNEVSAGLEDLQLTVGEGPCLDAFVSGGPVLVADLAGAIGRWPGFASAAMEYGAAAVFSFPLHIGVYRLGSLDFYREAPTSLSNTEITDALMLADLATQTIIEELDGHKAQDVSWLADPHAEVHQATGMVQIQLCTTTESALLRLRAHAYTHELPLAEVARQVTGRTLRFSSDPDDDSQIEPA